MKAIGVLPLLLAPAMWAQTCPSITFVGPADVALVGRTGGQGFAGGLSRQEDGSFTLRRFSGFATNFTQTNTPQFQQNFYSCIGLPPRPTPMRPPGYMHGADEVGVQSRNPLFTRLGTAGTIAGIGFGPYSTSNTQLTVWQANGTTPGARANHAILTNPEGLLVADFNGDGRKDVAVLSQRNFNEITGRVQVFPGNADGTLGTRIDTATGESPSSMAAFDFNGDNKLDLVVGHFNTAGLILLLGNGDGTFQAGTTIGPSGKAVAVADLNKDGKADLVVGRNDGLDVRLGNGNGTFQAANRIRIGVNYPYVAAGDFNKDGNLDIAAASIDGIVSVYLGNGAGAFPASNTYLTRDNAEYMIVVDFDWDGNLDVVFAGGHPDGLVVQPFDHNLTVLFGRGDGTLHAASAYDSLGGINGMAIGDLNGDGRADIVTVRLVSQGANVGLLINTGGGRFEPGALMTFSFQSQSWPLSAVDVADINGDGRLDIIAGANGRVFTALGNGNGTFQAASSFAAGNDITSLMARDFNGDNRADIAFTSANSDQVFVVLSNANGTPGTATPITVGKRPVHLAIADLNGDNRQDLVVTNEGQIGTTTGGSVGVLLGAGNGTFAPPANTTAGMFPTDTTVADANGDGRLDLVVATQGANFAFQVQLHAGRGDGTFQAPTILPVDFGPGQVGVGDFDGDSKIDLIVPHCCGDTSLGILVGNGNGTFQAEVLRPAGIGQQDLRVRDVNGDGRPDVMFLSSGFSGGAGVAVFLNVSGGAVIDECSFSTNRTGATASALGDTVGVTVTANQPSCTWNATSDQGWVTFGGALPRAGTGALRMTVAANPGAARMANVTVAGRAFTITQAATGCGFTIDPLSQTVPGAGGPFTFNVATQAGCAWSPLSSQSFLTITQGAGAMGPGQAGYNVAANAATARTASVSVAGEIQQVVQAAANPAQQFNDVPVTHPFYNFISIMRDRTITSGCNTSNYCPDASTTRGQMAVFIVRALFGGDNFPFNSTPFFTDVPSTHPFFRWIQKMRELGVTSGCTATTYCPDSAVTRGQMAAFIIRARLGLAAGDPLAFPLAAYFGDVTATHPFFAFVQKMRQLAVTSGCTAANYCPESETSRGQMSVFIVRGLLTP